MKMRYLKNVVTLSIIPAKCKKCGTCLNVCPHDVFTLSQTSVVIKERDACIECGACAKNCPFGAIVVDVGVGCAYALIFSKDGTCCE